MKRTKSEPTTPPDSPKLPKSDSDSPKFSISDCIKKLDTFTSTSKKWQLTRSNTKFAIENIEQCADPLTEFRNCLQNCINEAIEDAVHSLGDATKVGVTISSVLLDQGDIYIPLTPINANLVDAVFNQFQKVEQSKSKTVNLYGEPFTITVTVLNANGLPKQRSISGKGRDVSKTPNYLLKIENNDNFCLFYALELMRMYSLYKRGIITRMRWRWINEHQTTVLKEKVRILLQETGIPQNEPEYDASIYIPIVQSHYSSKYPGEYKIYIYNSFSSTPIFVSNTTEYHFAILLYHKDNHFDGIKTITKLFNKRYYCLSCSTGYSNKSVHTMKCTSFCFGCRENGPDYPCEIQENFRTKCKECNNVFYNKDCYNRHLRKKLCTKFQRCVDCGVIYNLEVHSNEPHKCGEKFCRICKQFHDKDYKNEENPCSQCFIQPMYSPKIKPYRIIAFDFECTQDKKVGPKKFEHEVNFAAATVICTDCISKNIWKDSLLQHDCHICGPFRTITFAPFEFSKTTVDKKVTTKTQTNSTLQKFVEWILFEQNPKFPTMAFAHYGGRYDLIMVLKEMIAQYIHNPEVIKQGNRLFEIKVKKHEHGPQTIFHDSFNLMPIKLSGLIKSFGLKIQDKQHFPHMFNKSTNYNNPLPHLPPKIDYCPMQKKKTDREAFDEWYSSNYNQPFDLKEKLPEYCCNDVQILTHALVELRSEFMELTKRKGKHGGLDILWQAVTIASACVKNFALNHLKPKTLAIVPERGYTPMQNQSVLALKYLSWYSKNRGVQIQTALSRYGEYKFQQEGQTYLVDGFIKGLNGQRDKIIEVNGCLWHCCELCYGKMEDNDKIPGSGKTVKQIREREARKQQLIRKYCDLKIIWEHEIAEELEHNKMMREHWDNWMDETPIKIRDAFHGGRTNAAKLIHTVQPGFKIGYKDFTSLYPETNRTTAYPLGHPNIINIPRGEQIVNWSKKKDNPYKGILKILLQPPNNNISVTVMPAKFDERLLFPTCRTCAQFHFKNYPNGKKDDNYSCTHYQPNERAFVSTCTHYELNAALDAGYVVRKVFQVLHYDNWSEQIFKSYVSEMMALKIHATGFPVWCKTEEEKDQYVNECWQLFNIKIEKEKMKFDPGKRYIAKLSLNSLWGRFSLRNLLSKCIIDNDPHVLHQYEEDKKIEVQDVQIIDEDNEVAMITYRTKEEFVEENKYSNVVLSIFTTSAARLKLYNALKKVADNPGCEILYYDTDSVIYVYPEDSDPLPEGKGHLGELTNEKPDHEIIEFISAGCKNYGLMLKNKKNGNIEYDTKIKGFTLDEQTCQKLHYEEVKKQIKNWGTDNPSQPISIIYPTFIRPNIVKGKLYTTSQTKIYQPIITKGIVNNDFKVLEFGFRKM